MQTEPTPGPCPACLLRLALDEPADAGDPRDLDGAVDPWPDYQVVTLLEAGARDTTYLARRARGTEFVELRVSRLAPRLTPDEFVAWAREASGIRHAGIAATLGGRVTPQGECCVISEYVGGPPIDRYCERAGVSAGEALRLFDLACEAVAHAHSHGVTHGRLGPGHVRVFATRGGPAVKVAGWSLSVPPAPPGEDVAALAALLRTLAGVPALGDGLGPVVERLARLAGSPGPESLAALRAAAAGSTEKDIAR